MTKDRALRLLQAILFLFVLALGLASVHSPGTWTHLRTGAWIAETGGLPAADPFSYMTGGALWRAHDWLADLAMHGIVGRFGPWGLIGLKSVLVAAAFAALLPLGARTPFLAVGVLALAACGAWPGLTELPAAVDFLMLAALLRWLQAKPAYSVGLLCRVAALSTAWANLHPAGAWAGAALVAVAAFRRSMGGTRAQRLGWTATAAAPFAALLTNPHAGGAWSAVSSSGDWALSAGLFNLYGVFLAAGAASAWVCLQEDFTLAVSGMTLAALSLLKPSFGPLYLLAAAPLVTAGLGHFLERVEPTRVRVAGLSALLASALLSYVVNVTVPRGRLLGFESRQTAEGALGFLEANGVTGRMFNDLGSAPYLLWRGGPARQVFADPRPGLYDRGVLEDARRWPERWSALSATYRFDYAVVENAGSGYSGSALDGDPGWGLAYVDDASLVYLRKGGPNDAVLRRAAFRRLRPGRWLDPVEEEAFGAPGGKLALLVETERAVAAAPGAVFPALARAYAFQRLGEEKEAEALRLRALELGPWKPEHRGLGARLLELQGDWAGAARGYRRAALQAERAGRPLAASAVYARLAAGYGARGEARRARRFARRASELDPENAEAQALLRKP